MAPEPTICDADEETLRCGQATDAEIRAHLLMHAGGRCPNRSEAEREEYARRVESAGKPDMDRVYVCAKGHVVPAPNAADVTYCAGCEATLGDHEHAEGAWRYLSPSGAYSLDSHSRDPQLNPRSGLPVLGREAPSPERTNAAQAEGYRRIAMLLHTGGDRPSLYGEVQFIVQQMSERGA